MILGVNRKPARATRREMDAKAFVAEQMSDTLITGWLTSQWGQRGAEVFGKCSNVTSGAG